MGTTPMESSSLKVLTAFKYRVRYMQASVQRPCMHSYRQTHIGDVTSGQKDLRDGLLQLSEKIIPERNETALADRS